MVLLVLLVLPVLLVLMLLMLLMLPTLLLPASRKMGRVPPAEALPTYSGK